MTRCREMLSLLVDYLERRLPDEVQDRLEQHLSGCSTCVAYLESYQSTITLLGSLREVDLPPELRMRLQAFLDDRSRN
jgi:hypothetical protein